jgi:hypothetical protein
MASKRALGTNDQGVDNTDTIAVDSAHHHEGYSSSIKASRVLALFIMIGAVVWLRVMHDFASEFKVSKDPDKTKTPSTRQSVLKSGVLLSSLSSSSKNDSSPMPLSSLITDTEANIIAPVDWILQFAHIGMPKTASTSIMQLLYSHPETQMYDQEIHSLQNARPAQLVKEMYELPSGRHFQRGYKSPGEISRIHCLYAFEKYFFNTKLIIGVRHPIWLFQSWFNFRMAQNRRPNDKSPMIYLDSGRLPQSLEFHKNIAQLGKTNSSSAEEQALLGTFPRPIPKKYYPAHEKLNLSHTYFPKLGNKVFLYAEEQLHDKETVPVFLSDLQSFLDLNNPFVDMPHNNSHEIHFNEHSIDICQAEYAALRNNLTQLGSNMADWILQYFVLLKDEVAVSSPKQFRKLLLQWKEDPCIK